MATETNSTTGVIGSLTGGLLSPVVNLLGSLLTPVNNLLGGVLNPVVNLLGGTVNDGTTSDTGSVITDGVTTGTIVTGGSGNLLGSVLSPVINLLGGVLSPVNNLLSGVLTGGTSSGGLLSGLLGGTTTSAVGTLLTPVVNLLSGALGTVINAGSYTNGTGNLLSSIGGLVNGSGSVLNGAGGVLNGSGSVLNVVGGVVSSVVNLLGDALGSTLGYGNGYRIQKGTAGDDALVGASGQDVLIGAAGNDTLFGAGGNDILDGADGNDTLDGGVGNDLLIGGSGHDIFRFTSELNASTNVDTVKDFTVGVDLIQLENTIFTKLATSGALAAENFRASSTGAAADADDYILYNTSTGALSYDADGNGAGAAVQFATVGIDSHPVLTASDFYVGSTISTGEVLGTFNGYRAVKGTAGDDVLVGETGKDVMMGGAGTDVLFGSGGDDILDGADGNDIIDGGLGNDTLMGGAGHDVFLFSTTPNSAANKDTIVDFKVGTDAIMLENAVFTSLTTAGVLAAANFRASSTGTAADADDFVLFNTATGVLSYDADGNGAGAAVEIAVVGTNSHPALTASDFLVS